MKNRIYILAIILLNIIITECKKPVPVEMVIVEKGSFIMGSEELGLSEKPVHKVTITKSFFIGKYEITFEQYDVFCNDTKHNKAMDYGYGREKHPVIGVKWTDVMEFCNWMSKKEKLKECYRQTGNNADSWVCDFNANGYRLPTEAEWEYAAKGGNKSKDYKFSGSNNNEEVAWYNGNSKTTSIVGQKKPNELGIYDMSGNVFEWCWDWFNGSFYENSPQNDPVSSFDTPGKQTSIHIGRGGSYNSGILSLRSATRSYDGFDPQRKSEYGFRVVRNDE